MAKVKVEEIVDHLRSEFRRALADTIRMHFPEAEFDEKELYRTFKRRVYSRCSIWENVPDDCVDAE